MLIKRGLILVGVLLVALLLAWSFRFDFIHYEGHLYIKDRWTGQIHDCVDGRCYNMPNA
jgi:hypothetical protein